MAVVVFPIALVQAARQPPPHTAATLICEKVSRRIFSLFDLFYFIINQLNNTNDTDNVENSKNKITIKRKVNKKEKHVKWKKVLFINIFK